MLILIMNLMQNIKAQFIFYALVLRYFYLSKIKTSTKISQIRRLIITIYMINLKVQEMMILFCEYFNFIYIF